MAKIKGSWDAYLGDIIINYNGKRRIGTYSYGDKVDKKGYVKAKVWHDADQDGVLDKDERVIAKYKADARVIYYEMDAVYDTGEIKINSNSGDFKLFHDDQFYGKGKILNMDYFFD